VHVIWVGVAAIISHRMTEFKKVVEMGTPMTTTLASGTSEKPVQSSREVRMGNHHTGELQAARHCLVSDS